MRRLVPQGLGLLIFFALPQVALSGGDVDKALNGAVQIKAPQLISSLNDASLKIRTNAVEELCRLGESAIEPVVKAAESDDALLRYQCFSVLEMLLRSEKADLSRRTKSALQKLGTGQR